MLSSMGDEMEVVSPGREPGPAHRAFDLGPFAMKSSAGPIGSHRASMHGA